ncbi:MAG TPA: ATP-dependent Clp protease ATP-binding subunit [Candidatus Eubacterium faecipullorum]|uniref:ATP-dependent Clp protease ATP-binding subunit n=1 Tax=Candidatus Eubacterium faecipullorum TaxID=2838571 RepID=A0A9D1UFS5_9FIRM|nr:ATP-dependent Clp protease ATP-binding subunit [Candidatus Eubacterium faecipullorum]
MYRFNNFTQKANDVLNLAMKAAENFGHTYIGSEHILIGVLKENTSYGAQLLSEKGVTLENIEELIKESTGVGNPTALSPNDFTPTAKRVLEVSFQLARGMRNSFVGTEHLLLALLRESDSGAVKLLNACGVDAESFTEELVSDLSKPNAEFRGSRSGKKGKSNTPTLDEFGTDLTEKAQNGGIDPVIGREKEIERVIQILSRRTKNNPCLIGEPGVGKTAIAEGLALKIVKDEVPELLAGKKIVALDLTSMVAGTKYRGDFEERIKKAMDEVKNAKNVILFIDEVHTLIGAGAAEGAVDAANILKPALARGEIQVIGATTIDEYRKNIEKDAALERRFQSVMVGEPTEEEAIEILKGLRDKYEAHHKVKISDEAIENAVKMSARYIADRFLPDKAIDLIDEAASRVRLKAFTAPPNLKSMEQEIKRLEQEKASAVKSQDFETAAKLRDKEKELQTLLDGEKEKWKNLSGKEIKEVTTEDIANVVSSWSGIPVTQLTEEESERLLNMEKILHERIVGQDKAVSAVSKAIRRGRVGIKNPNRPLGSFIFLGPTGVGKTELCKSLAEAMFGSEEAIIKLDMSEYMEKHTVSKLIGSPPGYVGFEEGGQLTEKIRRKPYSVVLFDEIEKAHPDVFNMLLQILEDGVLTDSKGRKVSFKNAIIIMTSNVGASKITNGTTSLGFGESGNENKNIEELVTEDLKKTFKPEFLNRIDEIIVFNRLEKDDIKEIAKRMLGSLDKRLAEMDITLSFTDNAISAIADAGFDDVYGARPLRRAIQQKIEDPLSELMLEKKVVSGGSYVADYKDGKFTFENAGGSSSAEKETAATAE